MAFRARGEPAQAAVAPSAVTATATADMADLAAVAAREPGDVLAGLGSRRDGLSGAEAQERLRTAGPNAIRSHHAQPLAVLGRQLRSPLLLLLLAAATVSFFVGERSDAVIIGAIVTLSVALGFVNEFQAERAVEALHAQLRHRTVVRRDGSWQILRRHRDRAGRHRPPRSRRHRPRRRPNSRRHGPGMRRIDPHR